MMVAAERHGEFVANLATERSGLCEFQMMGIARRALTDQAGLRGDECEVGRDAASHRLAQRGHLFLVLRPLIFRCGGHRGGITVRSLRRTDRTGLDLAHLQRDSKR
jgi:hypothetical protein